MAQALHVQKHEIQTRLHTLGVTEEQLRDAASQGVAARRRCTAFHPPSSPGFYQWSEIHVALRQTLVPLNWRHSDVGGFSTVVSPDGSIAISVATGSDRTGKPGLPDPTTKYPRGAMTHAAVEINQQTTFDLHTGETILPDTPSRKLVTWWLLVATRHDEVRLELSCPTSIGDDGRIDSWSERILLDPLGIEPTLPMLPDDEPDPTPIDVHVERL
jgi:hypothetical protein